MPPRPVAVLTRLPEDNRALAERLRAAGARVVEYPCLHIRLLPWDGGAVEGTPLADFRAVAFSSKWGVAGVAARAAEIRACGALLAAVGAETARHVEEAIGRAPDVIADPATGEALALALAERLAPGDLVLHARGNLGAGKFKQVLEGKGIGVREIEVYENSPGASGPLELNGPAVVAFASPSAVTAFFEANPCLRGTTPCVAIGPTTAKRLFELGAMDVKIADEATEKGLADCILQWLDEMEATNGA